MLSRGRYVDAVEVWDLVVHLRRIVLRACDRHDGFGAVLCAGLATPPKAVQAVPSWIQGAYGRVPSR